jgi:hypothetical protein
MFIRMAVVYGKQYPPHQRMFIQLAPPEKSDAVVALWTHAGVPQYCGIDEIDSVRASSGGYTFFGFGASGMFAAGVASALDNLLAPWDLVLEGGMGAIHLYAQHGPPFSDDDFARVQSRLLAGGYAPESGDDAEQSTLAAAEYAAALARLVELGEQAKRRQTLSGAELILWDLDHQMWDDEEVSEKAAKALRRIIRTIDQHSLLDYTERDVDEEEFAVRELADYFNGRRNRLDKIRGILDRGKELDAYVRDFGAFELADYMGLVLNSVFGELLLFYEAPERA